MQHRVVHNCKNRLPALFLLSTIRQSQLARQGLQLSHVILEGNCDQRDLLYSLLPNTALIRYSSIIRRQAILPVSQVSRRYT